MSVFIVIQGVDQSMSASVSSNETSGSEGDAFSFGLMSILPLKLHPSSSTTLGDTIFPWTIPVWRIINCSVANRFPSWFPSIAIVLPWISALILPFCPIVTLWLWKTIFPSISPSISRFSSPDISPLIDIEEPITDLSPEWDLDSWSGKYPRSE